MKFGKNLIRVVELSDPEWGPFWMNYKHLKKKINDIVVAQGGKPIDRATDASEMAKIPLEVDFFSHIRLELKKVSDFFDSSHHLYMIRHQHVKMGYDVLKSSSKQIDQSAWKRLLAACIKLYKDVLLLENFAIMNYCGFSKILKKHDKLTGFTTRVAFMRNVMSRQNFTHYEFVLVLIRDCEQLFNDIQLIENSIPLQDEERLFIEAIRDLNNQANKMHAEESCMSTTLETSIDQDIGTNTITNTKTTPNNSTNTNNIATNSNNHNSSSSENDRGIGVKDNRTSSDASSNNNNTSPNGPISKKSKLFPSDPNAPISITTDSEVETEVTMALSNAADAVLSAASKANANNASPDIRDALSWVHAISRPNTVKPTKTTDSS